MKNNYFEPMVNIKNVDNIQFAPEWIKLNAVIVQRGALPYLAEIIGFSKNNNPIIEYDCDGSDLELTNEELERRFEPYVEGMPTYDPTGKDRKNNPQAYK